MKKIKELEICCVILAAGLSRRFGASKMLATLGRKETLLQRTLDAANNSKADEVLVVLGHHSSEIAGSLKLGRAQIIYNKDYRKGLSTSIRSGIGALGQNCAGALLMVADQPLIDSKILNRLISKFKSNKSGKIVALGYRGEVRNPVIIPKFLFSEVASLRGDKGARDIILRHLSKALVINVKDPGILADIDRKSDLKKL